jgi:hypothetical protein
MTQVVYCLPSKHKDMSSNLVSYRRRIKKKRRRRKRRRRKN